MASLRVIIPTCRKVLTITVAQIRCVSTGKITKDISGKVSKPSGVQTRRQLYVIPRENPETPSYDDYCKYFKNMKEQDLNALLENVWLSQRKLFTPGPLCVSDRVKRAMLSLDPGSRHAEFTYTVKFVRSALLRIAKVSEEDFTVIPLNGSGALATEATLRTMMSDKKGQLLVIDTGCHGKRIVDMCQSCGINVKVIPMNLKTLQDAMVGSENIQGVVTVHCEAASGLVNPVQKIGEMVKKTRPDCLVFVDAMTSFGAIPVDMKNIDFLISNSSKSLQGAPGISFVIARKKLMEKSLYHGDSLVLDLTAQYEELERSGQFRFTPPTHVMNALKEALLEFSDEGGLQGRAVRYRENCMILKKGMTEMGFQQVFKDEENPQGYLITSFRYPKNPLFVFEEFYSRLADTGYLIAPQEMSPTNAFCVSNIGNLYPDDITELLHNIRQVCSDMRLKIPLQECKY